MDNQPPINHKLETLITDLAVKRVLALIEVLTAVGREPGGDPVELAVYTTEEDFHYFRNAAADPHPKVMNYTMYLSYMRQVERGLVFRGYTVVEVAIKKANMPEIGT